MERIKKALEKAKKQRQLVSNQSQSLEKQSSRKESETQQIAYSETQQIEISSQFLQQNRIVAGVDDDPSADLYKMLRTKVLQKMQANSWNFLAVTSPGRGQGKSLTAINLAISIAMDANYSVLLVDLDLRKPSLHEYFGLSGDSGLSEYFAGEKTISELLIHPGLEKLVLLPAGKPLQRSSDLLSTPKMMELAKELKQRYLDRIVIVDLPPLLRTDDSMIFMPNVDACILVVAEGESNEEDIKKSIQMIGQEKYLGSILNKSAEVNLTNEVY